EADSILSRLIEVEMPTVVINRYADDEPVVDQVVVDHRQAFLQATRSLIEQGYQQVIVETQFPGFSVVQQNIAGIRAAIDESGRDVSIEIMKCGTSRASVQEMLARTIQSKTKRTVLVASSSLLAAWSIEMLRSLK